MGNIALLRTRKGIWDENKRRKKMAAENGMEVSGFMVDKGKEVDEDENKEEIAEISLSPDLEAEEARKKELRLQAQKVKTSELCSLCM